MNGKETTLPSINDAVLAIKQHHTAVAGLKGSIRNLNHLIENDGDPKDIKRAMAFVMESMADVDQFQ